MRLSSFFIRVCLAEIAIAAMAAPVRGGEPTPEREVEQLDSAFEMGLSLHDEADKISARLEVERFGGSALLVGATDDGDHRLELACRVCTPEELQTKARALGAILAARASGLEPARLGAKDGNAIGPVLVDGIPLAPGSAEHPIEPGPHRIRIKKRGEIHDVELSVEPGEAVEITSETTAVSDWGARVRPAVIVGGLGLTAAALGGLFLWLHGECATSVVDSRGNCEEQHNLTGAGWVLIAGGVLIQGVTIFLLLGDEEKQEGGDQW